jgi:hypothetical protein
MPIKMIRLMDSYSQRLDTIETHRLQDVRHAALRLAAEIDKVLGNRAAEQQSQGVNVSVNVVLQKDKPGM